MKTTILLTLAIVTAALIPSGNSFAPAPNQNPVSVVDPCQGFQQEGTRTKPTYHPLTESLNGIGKFGPNDGVWVDAVRVNAAIVDYRSAIFENGQLISSDYIIDGSSSELDCVQNVCPIDEGEMEEWEDSLIAWTENPDPNTLPVPPVCE